MISVHSAIAGCEDGANMAEEAVIRMTAKSYPTAHQTCRTQTVFIRQTNDGEIDTVKRFCKGHYAGSFDVILIEFEDAVCFVKSIKRTKG